MLSNQFEYTLSILANAAYTDYSGTPPDTLPDTSDTAGFSFLDDDGNPSILAGFYAVTFYDDDNGNHKLDDGELIVVSFRGTNPGTSVDDAEADVAIGQPTDAWHSQFEQAITTVLHRLQTYPESEILVTGHSLGGSLAQVTAHMFNLGGAAFDPGGAQNIVNSNYYQNMVASYNDNPEYEDITFGLGPNDDFRNFFVASSPISGLSGAHIEGNDDEIIGADVNFDDNSITVTVYGISQIFEILSSPSVSTSTVSSFVEHLFHHKMSYILDLMSTRAGGQFDSASSLYSQISNVTEYVSNTGNIGFSTPPDAPVIPSYTLSPYRPVLIADNGDNTILGTNGDDTIYAMGGTDVIGGYDGNDIIDLGSGDDGVFGGNGNDQIRGGSGQNAIWGDGGDDFVEGGPDYDEIWGGEGSDDLNGGNGNDYIYGDDYIDGNDENDGNDHISGGNGNDTILDGSGDDTVEGGPGNDSIISGPGADYLAGGPGDDSYRVYDAQDTIVELADGGEDTIGSEVDYQLPEHVEHLLLHGGVQGTGNDLANRISGNDGSNLLSGGAGDDRLDGGLGDDTLYGGDGNDTLYGRSGDDALSGGDGGDLLIGDLGDDTLDGGDGDDALLSGGGYDRIFGGNGDDLINLIDLEGELDGGLGKDYIWLDLTQDTVDRIIDLSAIDLRMPISQVGNLEISNVESIGQIEFGSGNDTLIYYREFLFSYLDGGGGFDRLTLDFSGSLYDGRTAAGIFLYLSLPPLESGLRQYQVNLSDGSIAYVIIDDFEEFNIRGSSFDDVIEGNVGNDVLDGGAGNDTLVGGTGNDTYVIDSLSDAVNENIAAGTDTLVTPFDTYIASYGNIENLTLDGTGNLYGVGNVLANTITGNSGSNLLIGGDGNDTLHGGAGVDSLFGEAGDDTLNGDAGIDYLVGGIGDDTLDGGDDPDALYGEDGADALYGGIGFHTDILVGGAGNDALYGNSGLNDYDLMDGGSGDDAYYVDTGADLTFEADGGGTDTVYADVSNVPNAGVYLYAYVENLLLVGTTAFGVGNELANNLTGSASGNWLLGGAGNDTINGKEGNDVLFGEAGADIFVFETGSAADVIGDFNAAEDQIDLSDYNFADFTTLANSFHQVGNDGAIDLGGGNLIVLHNVTMATLNAGDFIL